MFINLRGYSGESISHIDSMQMVVHTFDPTIALPADEYELASLYRSLISSKPSLLVFDNVASETDVLPLLPQGPDSLTIITSRAKIKIPNAAEIELSGFDAQQARELLLSISPRIGEFADEIARICGYLPLAIRLAGSFLEERIDLSPQGYVNRIQDNLLQSNEKSSLQSPLFASLTVSFNYLTAEQKDVLVLLTVFADYFALDAASYVLDIEQKDLANILNALIKYSFLNWDATRSRYYFHPLIRQFASSQLSNKPLPDAISAARIKQSNHYLNVLRSANELYLKGDDSMLAGLRLFDNEKENIYFGQSWAAENAKGDIAAARLCSDYAVLGNEILQLRQLTPERIRWLSAGLEASERVGDKAAMVAHLSSLGSSYADSGDPEQATALYRRALETAYEVRDRRAEAIILSQLGEINFRMTMIQEAIEFYEKSLAISREIADTHAAVVTLNNIGEAKAYLGMYEDAQKFYQESLTLSEKIGDRRIQGHILTNLGLIYNSTNQFSKAQEVYQDGLSIVREIGDRRGESLILTNLGNVYADLGEYQRALELYDHALSIAREIGDRRGESIILSSFGYTYSITGDSQSAIKFYEQALSIQKSISDDVNRSITLRNLGSQYIKTRKLDQGIKLFNEALEINKRIGDSFNQANTLRELGAAYLETDEIKDALSAFMRALELQPNDAKIYVGLASAYAALEDLETAQTNINKAIELDPLEGRAWMLLGDLHARRGSNENALRAYDKALEIGQATGNIQLINSLESRMKENRPI